MTTATTAYFLIVSSLALAAAVWAWCLAVAASSDARIAREDAEAALDDVHALAAEVDVLHRTVGPQPVPDPDESVDLVPVDDTTVDRGAAEFEDIDDVRGMPVEEWLDAIAATPVMVLGSIPPEDPGADKTAPKHRKEA
jgi:hypothetical protein